MVKSKVPESYNRLLGGLRHGDGPDIYHGGIRGSLHEDNELVVLNSLQRYARD